MPVSCAPLFLLFPNLEVGRLKGSRLQQNLQEVVCKGPKGCGGTKGCGQRDVEGPLYPYSGGIPRDVEEAVAHRVGSQLSKGSSR